MKSLILLGAALISMNAVATDLIRVEVGKNYQNHTNEELRKRVWHLERAVAQLQDQVFQLAVRGGASTPVEKPWTCRLQSFATTHVASGPTKAEAIAQVLQKCSQASHAMHCKESDTKCGNE